MKRGVRVILLLIIQYLFAYLIFRLNIIHLFSLCMREAASAPSASVTLRGVAQAKPSLLCLAVYFS